jgi:excisionase family DNA binding protein
LPSPSPASTWAEHRATIPPGCGRSTGRPLRSDSSLLRSDDPGHAHGCRSPPLELGVSPRRIFRPALSVRSRRAHGRCRRGGVSNGTPRRAIVGRSASSALRRSVVKVPRAGLSACRPRRCPKLSTDVLRDIPRCGCAVLACGASCSHGYGGPTEPGHGDARAAAPGVVPRDEVMTAAEVADLLHLPVSTVYYLARRGEIPACRLGRAWRFLRPRIEKLLGS